MTIVKSYFLVPFLFILFFSFAATAQEQNLNFEHLDITAGLSQNNVVCVLQDSKGFMWIGTIDGLNKYDGYKITVYRNDLKNENSVSHNFISGIIEDSKGTIWVATRGGGLNRYDREKDRFMRFKNDKYNTNSLSSDLLTGLAADSDGNLWIGTEDRGLNYFEPGRNRFLHYTHNKNNDKSLSGDFIWNVFVDSRQSVWVATYGGGLDLFDKKNASFTSFRHDAKDSNSLTDDRVFTIYEDSKHCLWVGTDGGGLNLLNRNTGRFHRFQHNTYGKKGILNNSVVYGLAEDNKNNLWIGTDNGGLFVFNPSTGVFYNYVHDVIDNNSLSNRSIHSLYKDISGNIWVGTFSGGVNIYKNAVKFTHYKHTSFPNSLIDNNVSCIFEDSKKNLWIGSDEGLDLFDPARKKFTHYRHEDGNKNSICGNSVLSVCEDGKGNLWVGTWGDGVTVFNPSKNTYKHFRHDPSNPSSISNNNGWVIFEDSDKKIWIGTHEGGLNLYNPADDSFTQYAYTSNNSSNISNKKIHSLFDDRKGNLWIGTDGGGLDVLNKKTMVFTHFMHDDRKNSISDDRVRNIFEDQKGNFWIGTMAGLNYFDIKNNTFKTYTIEDGLPDNAIFGMLEDAKGNLWLSTNRGISRFNPSTKSFKNFVLADGLQSYEFKENAYCKTSTGTMYFGGTNGFNEFNPDSIRENTQEPPLLLTGLQILNKDVSIAKDTNDPSPLKKAITELNEITLPYNHSVISFEFASLNFTTPEKKQYAYMLEGFDKNWNMVGYKHTASYTNLDPGEYVFKVKGMNYEGEWSSRMQMIKLIIPPPFWLTWWFRSGIAMLVIGGSISFYQFRIKNIKARNNHLEQLTKQLANSISEEQKARQNEEKARMEAEQASRAKSEFMANMSHELRTPMNGIIGFTDLVLNTNLQAGQREHLQNVNKSAYNLMDIINDILDFSKMEAGKLFIDHTNFQLNKLVEDTVDIMSIKAVEKNLELICEIDPELSAQLLSDPVRIRQILVNLLGNAIKFTASGEIIVSVKKQGIIYEDNKQYQRLSISVKDTGIGIPKEKLAKIFESFTQVDPSTTRKYGGTGLGLTISKNLAELLNGSVHVISEPGKGSIFTVQLALEIATPGEQENAEKKNGGSKQQVAGPAIERFVDHVSILVAEDDPLNMLLISEVLTKMGFDLIKAGDGKEVMKLLAHHNPALILMDINMPEMDGYSATRAIRQLPYPQNNIPIIALTADAMQEDKDRCLKAGMDDYISKPFKLEELKQALEKYIVVA